MPNRRSSIVRCATTRHYFFFFWSNCWTLMPAAPRAAEGYICTRECFTRRKQLHNVSPTHRLAKTFKRQAELNEAQSEHPLPQNTLCPLTTHWLALPQTFTLNPLSLNLKQGTLIWPPASLQRKACWLDPQHQTFPTHLPGDDGNPSFQGRYKLGKFLLTC